MLIAADYPFMDVLWTMIVFFVWVAWLVILFRIVADVFRRHDISGWGKAGWLIFVIVLPFLGVLVYMIAQGHAMAQRDIERSAAARADFEAYIREVAASESGTAGGAKPPPPQPTG
jgi:Phospholipase_D-nuclease N-terminal